jgi:hypothetical protein
MLEILICRCRPSVGLADYQKIPTSVGMWSGLTPPGVVTSGAASGNSKTST